MEINIHQKMISELLTDAATAVEPFNIQKLKNSITERIYQVIKSKRSHIGK